MPERCSHCFGDKRCQAFQDDLLERGELYSLSKCPYGFAACLVKIDAKHAIVCGLNVKHVSPKNWRLQKDVYLPAISKNTALNLVRQNVSFIEKRNEADIHRKFIPTMVHGLSKILDRARTKGEYLLQNEDVILDKKTREALTSVAVATLAATVIFYANRVQAENSIIGTPRSINVYGKFYKMRKLLENVGSHYQRIEFCGEPKYNYNLYVSFEVAVFQLLENAAKYSPPGYKVSVNFKEDSTGLIIEISNIGPHLSRRELRKIKEFRYRGENAQKFTDDGSGIGLASVTNIAEANGVRFDVDSKLSTIEIGGILFSEFIASLKLPIALRGDEIVGR